MIGGMDHSWTPRHSLAVVTTAAAVAAYIVTWLLTTQVADVRAIVPFGEDPYDLVASVAIVLLPLVGGLTGVRILRYGASRVPAGAVAARIELGLAICLALVSAALAAAMVALWWSPMDGPGIPLAIWLESVLTIAAWASLALAITAGASGRPSIPDETEPDALDDVVALLPLTVGLRERIGHSAELLRRHRIFVGLGGAMLTGVAAVLWHALREGPWASPVAAFVYGGILVAILLVAYGLLLGPLRVLRSA